MKVIMFSKSVGSLTTTFIRNEISHFSEKHDLVYVATNVLGSIGPGRAIEVSYDQPKWKEKWNWWRWQRDLSCNFKNKNFAHKLEAILDEEGADIHHFHFGYEALMFLQNSEPLKNVLIHFHGYDASEMLRKRSYIEALNLEIRRHKATVIYVSDDMRDHLVGSGVRFENSFMLRYGIDLSLFEPTEANKEKGVFRFVQVSSLVEKKGHEYTLAAIAKAIELEPSLKGSVHFTFTGDGPRKSKLQELSSELGINSLVSFVGNKSPNEVKQLLDQSDAFLHHSVTAKNGDQEGIPNAIMEAMAMRLPVLSTFHAGIPELVVHGENGLLCNERQIDLFAEHIVEISKWEKLEISRNRIGTYYNMVLHNEQLESQYKKLIDDPN